MPSLETSDDERAEPDAAPPGAVRMRDVAARAGVSRMTVSRVLRDDGYVAAETRARVRAVIDELGYVPDRMPGDFAARRSGFVATLIPSIDNACFARTLRGLDEVLGPRGLQLLIGDTDYRGDQEEALVETWLARRPEGVILTVGPHTERTRALLQRAGIPVIQTCDLPRDPISDSVGFSQAEAGARVADHLAGRGHERLGFIGGATGRDVRGVERRRGFVERAAALGLPPVELLSLGEPPISARHGARAIELLLERAVPIDALMGVSDMTAFGAIMASHRAGLRVPGDLAIAGFGDFEIGRTCHPAITTVSCDWHELGRRAARQLLVRMEGDGKPFVGDPATVPVPLELFVRESA